MIPEGELSGILEKCKKGNSEAQDKLYLAFYGYAMGIAVRYCHNKEEALEIVNDSFFKVFTNLNKFTIGLSFKGWLRKIVVNSSIDYFRRNEKHFHGVDVTYAKGLATVDEDVISKISSDEIYGLIQALPPSYRLVFNLYVIEGYKHEEIAQKLGISVGTSKSNLSIARTKLQMAIRDNYLIKKRKHG